MLALCPLTRDEANALVARWHRHHGRIQGHRFAIGVHDEHGDFHGAAIVGRPLARSFDATRTAEVTRCVTDGTPNACSMLYAAAWRAWRAMGGERLITYTLATEPGTSLRAAGWRTLYQTEPRPRGWNTPSRPRDAVPQLAKTLWEVR